MKHLELRDLDFCVRRLPRKLHDGMKKHGNVIVVAGGYIRGVIAGEPRSDIDVFAGGKKTSAIFANEFKTDNKFVETDNAISIRIGRTPVQFIHRWTFDSPLSCICSFDFTICQAAIWYHNESKKWNSTCSDYFYPDLAAKRLIYTNPIREEEPGGSLLRILKYYQKGYRIPLDSFGAVIAKLVSAVDMGKIHDKKTLTRVITALLYEVDPAGFIDHTAYLPSMTVEPEDDFDLNNYLIGRNSND